MLNLNQERAVGRYWTSNRYGRGLISKDVRGKKYYERW